jgi:hypothetical protein
MCGHQLAADADQELHAVNAASVNAAVQKFVHDSFDEVIAQA